jgi:SAM-dependent methyltransferase
MKDYDTSTYGDRIADAYDELYPRSDPASIDLLAELAKGGPALELGIGTGRIALPLHERGVAVHGIDASEAMLTKLRAKPGGAEIHTHTGSFDDFEIGERFRLIYVVFNTFFGLLTQEEQLRCFASVSRHLAPDGVFLLEAFVPDLARFTDGQTVRAVRITEDEVHLDVSRVDPAAQQVSSNHVLIAGNRLSLYPVKLRYAWPSELDLMARLAGLKLRHRWGSWKKQAFTSGSMQHISVYGRTQ